MAGGQNIYEESLRTFLKPIAEYIDDAAVSEIMINGYKDIYIEKGGKLTKVESNFTERGVTTLAVNIAQFVGRQINEANPRLDARLPDGSRIHVVIPPIAKNGVIISIRKFFKEKLTVQRLIDFGSFTPEMARFIQVSVEMAKNMIISGGTGSGKTTLLNVLSNYIPASQRIITMEDALELQLANEHVVRFETRHPDKFGKGAVTMGDLLHSSLRLRPDRIILGEVRGGECFDLLQAMNTGHGGSMATVHANNPIETLSRLESLVLLGGIELPLRAIRAQVTGAIQIIVSAARYSDGSRRVGHISEVLPLNEKGDYVMQDIFIYTQTHKDEDGKIHGYSAPTGVLPSFFHKLKASGYHDMDESFFNPKTYGYDVPPLFMGKSYFTGIAEAYRKHDDEDDKKIISVSKPKKEESVKKDVKKNKNSSPKKTKKEEIDDVFSLDGIDDKKEKNIAIKEKIPKKEVKKEAKKEVPVVASPTIEASKKVKKKLTDAEKRELLLKRKRKLILKKKKEALLKRKQEEENKKQEKASKEDENNNVTSPFDDDDDGWDDF